MANSPAYLAVQEQIRALAQFYRTYSAESARQERERRSGLGWLGEFFSSDRRFSNDEMHTRFYEEVRARIQALAEAIGALPETEARQAAMQAVDILFDPVKPDERDTAGWMRFAAEPLCGPLLRYLDRPTLEALYRRYNEVYPKRLQFPAQVRLRREMERLLRQA